LLQTYFRTQQKPISNNTVTEIFYWPSGMRGSIHRPLTTHRWNSPSPSVMFMPLSIYKYTSGNIHTQVYSSLLAKCTYHFMDEYS